MPNKRAKKRACGYTTTCGQAGASTCTCPVRADACPPPRPTLPPCSAETTHRRRLLVETNMLTNMVTNMLTAIMALSCREKRAFFLNFFSG